METFFLTCFVFGALFTTASALFGFASSHAHVEFGGSGHGPGHVDGPGHGDGGAGDAGAGHDFLSHLPVFNLSSMLAFITWFGAAGFLLMNFAGWSALAASAVALLPGVLAAVLIGAILRKIMAGERVMRPRDYQLEGTISRVTVPIPANGVGEILFSMGGTRRSEAARSLSGRAIPYDAEVVIIEYEHGVALVQTWNEMLGRPEHEGQGQGRALSQGEPSEPSRA